MFKSLREFVSGPVGIVVGLVSAVLVVIAAIKFFGHHPRAGWMWFFFGALALVVLSFWRYHEMRKQRDTASESIRSVTQKVVDVGGEGAGGLIGMAGPGNIINLGQVHQSVGGPPTPYLPRKRWFPRLLTEEERLDLADRCEACSREALQWLLRTKPYVHMTHDPASIQLIGELSYVHEAETGRVFHAEYDPRIRDLLNECVEAGYSLPPDMENARVRSGAVLFSNRQGVAEGLGIVGRRVRRRSKRL